MDPQKAAGLLGRAGLFGGLPPETLRRLADRAVIRRYGRRQLIFHEGDPAESFFLIVDGSVKVFRASAEGETVILVTLEPGESFGELALLDGGPRSASAEALQDTVVLALERGPFLQTMSEEPLVAEALITQLGAILRRLTDHAADLVFLDLHGRVAKWLLHMADTHGRPEEGGTELDLQLTQSEIASIVGGSRQSVNQVLRSFERRGYVELHGRSMSLKDPDALRRRATP
jgi:CRP-like cAMP-binding protein